MSRKRLPVNTYVEGILKADRVLLSRAITLVESKLPADNALAMQIIEQVLPHTGNSVRLGITGVPGVGKSTFIEAFGTYITGLGKKLAVLAIDPSSQKTKGSIMGDKTRMEALAHNPAAYIRPSPTGYSLGGVSARTRETMLLCEAAGFDVIIIETVGVGQSETAVHGMVDFFLLLMLAGAGDELQGIKRGIMEMADAIAINKADGDNVKAANRAKAEYKAALHLFPATDSGWVPEVITCSAMANSGIDAVWQLVMKHHQQLQAGGHLARHRQQQQTQWMYEVIDESLRNSFYRNEGVANALSQQLKQVQAGAVSATAAAQSLLNLYQNKSHNG